MTDPVADHVVFGASAMARLLAGLLAQDHGRTVIHVGQSRSAYRLPRQLDLSVAPVTRPQTWSMLESGVPETVRLLTRIGARRALQRVDPLFFAEGHAAGEALSHIRHMASGFGVTVEPVPTSLLGSSRSGVVLRDALLLNQPLLEARLDDWLQRSGVISLAPDRVSIASDGAATLETGPEQVLARHAILADAEAIISWLPLRQWSPLLRRETGSTILTAPVRPLAAALMLEIQSGTTLHQQPDGGIVAMGGGGLSHFSGHLQALLGPQRQVEQAGQTAYQRLSTLDGAPAFGRAAGAGADVVVGMDGYGIFLAPALARWMASKATPAEQDWLGAHLVTRSSKSAQVAEYAPQGVGA
ncbi:MAG: hypothetical protein KIT02_00255 [Devosia sp.]|uniref:hypothetical protein n=1 Tax=Devosia sp. TaxID=1871048 RepID=UPI0024CD403A|nr:hypothetical protein [Devosia sp.]UYN99716.1 MAG: hypothetical protein KIT02_00255 [Devosia sp.]